MLVASTRPLRSVMSARCAMISAPGALDFGSTGSVAAIRPMRAPIAPKASTKAPHRTTSRN